MDRITQGTYYRTEVGRIEFYTDGTEDDIFKILIIIYYCGPVERNLLGTNRYTELDLSNNKLLVELMNL